MKKTYNINHLLTVRRSGRKVYPKRIMYDIIDLVIKMIKYNLYDDMKRRVDFYELLEYENTQRYLDRELLGIDQGRV